MAYNTVVIKKDADNKPIPQYYNPVTDEYEVLQGVGGAARQVLYGPDGQPISVADNKLAVRATELEEKLEAVRVLLNTLAGEDFATQTTLAQILEKMIANPATEAKQDSLATLVGAIEEKLDGMIDGTTGAARQVLYGSDGQPIATTEGKLAVKAEELETLLTALKEKDFATQATLATVLERLQAVERKIDGITDGTAPAKTQLTGSKIRLVRNLQTLNDPIEPGQSEKLHIYATAGHIATLNMFSFLSQGPDNATTGTHRLYASIDTELSVARFIEFANVYNARVLFNTYSYEGSASEERISASRQAINAGAIKFNDKIPLMIVYRNDTDVVQTKTRYLFVVVTEEAYI